MFASNPKSKFSAGFWKRTFLCCETLLYVTIHFPPHPIFTTHGLAPFLFVNQDSWSIVKILSFFWEGVRVLHPRPLLTLVIFHFWKIYTCVSSPTHRLQHPLEACTALETICMVSLVWVMGRHSATVRLQRRSPRPTYPSPWCRSQLEPSTRSSSVRKGRGHCTKKGGIAMAFFFFKKLLYSGAKERGLTTIFTFSELSSCWIFFSGRGLGTYVGENS